MDAERFIPSKNTNSLNYPILLCARSATGALYYLSLSAPSLYITHCFLSEHSSLVCVNIPMSFTINFFLLPFFHCQLILLFPLSCCAPFAGTHLLLHSIWCVLFYYSSSAVVSFLFRRFHIPSCSHIIQTSPSGLCFVFDRMAIFYLFENIMHCWTITPSVIKYGLKEGILICPYGTYLIGHLSSAYKFSIDKGDKCTLESM